MKRGVKMKKNRLGKSDIYISELTLGCMSLGTDYKQAARIVDTALDAGINHLDTADLYDFGLNEEIVGRAIQEKRKDITITTKVGNHFNKETKEWYWDPSRAYIIEALKNSLKRLNTDYIDFYMLHGGTIDDPIDETIDAFETLKKEGYIRAYGISSIRPNVIREYVNHSSIDGVMTQYSLLDRRPEEKILDLLHQNSISVLARGPLAKGMLSNQAENVIRRKGKNGYLNYTQEELTNIYHQIRTLITEQSPLNKLALSYVQKHPAIATAVFGASSVEQVIENTKFDSPLELPDDIYEQLKQITKISKYENHR